jgi:hypothetical protein
VAIIILRNDSSGALAALEYGSTCSPPLQEHAMTIARLCATHNATCLFLHVPGSVLIAEGIDDASRGGAAPELGPACRAPLRSTIHSFAARHWWTIFIDLFASASNTLTGRFFSRFPEPGAEAADAFSGSDWNASTCPSCGLLHREVFSAFPPPSLLPQFLAKARADGARGIVLTPTAVTGGHWNKLIRAALPLDGLAYQPIKHPMPLLQHCGGFSTSELALFAVDFGPGAFDSRSFSSPCPSAALPRPPPPPSALPADPALSAVRQSLQRSLRHP